MTVADTSMISLPDEAPYCWLCHDDGPDTSGKPMVRDCSCRGSTGFAHISCIINYAEHQGKKALEVHNCFVDQVTKAFDVCSNCEQEYQGHVGYQLKKAAVDFAEKSKRPNLCVHAMTNRLIVLDVTNEEDRQEGEEMCAKIVSIIGDMKQGVFARSRWYINDGFVYMEAGAYGAIGKFYMRIGSEESLKRAKTVLEKGCDLFRRMGDEVNLLLATEAVNEVEAKISGITHDGPELSSARKCYEYLLQNQGASDVCTIANGRKLAYALFSSGCALEAERLLQTLLETSRLTHGPNHETTVITAAYLRAVRVRKVILMSTDEMFAALRYEDEGKSCVLRGPLTDPEKDNEGHIMTVASSEISLHDLLGTPVVVHGLVHQAHLNGMIGDAREVDRGNRVCTVHFEEAGLEPAEIKYDNLRILFELPPSSLE
jgi:hypothetical protein